MHVSPVRTPIPKIPRMTFASGTTTLVAPPMHPQNAFALKWHGSIFSPLRSSLISALKLSANAPAIHANAARHGNDARQAANPAITGATSPVGSNKVTGLFLTNLYSSRSPPRNPIGTLLSHRATAISTMRCSRIVRVVDCRIPPYCPDKRRILFVAPVELSSTLQAGY
jgi:hypothetical protein